MHEELCHWFVTEKRTWGFGQTKVESGSRVRLGAGPGCHSGLVGPIENTGEPVARRVNSEG